jgi:single stranded DNA-binding protein
MNLNEVTLTGYVVDEPRVNTTANNKLVANLRLENREEYVDSFGENQIRKLFITVVCWSGSADVAKDLEVGDMVLIRGKLTPNVWEDQNGVKRSEIRITANPRGVLKIGSIAPAEETEDVPEEPEEITPPPPAKKKAAGTKKKVLAAAPATNGTSDSIPF